MNKKQCEQKVDRKMKRIGTYTWIAAIVLLCLCLVFFCSNNPTYWGSFGDYIGGIGSVVLSIVVFLYTYQTNQRAEEKKKNENNVQFLREIWQLIKKNRTVQGTMSEERSYYFAPPKR